MVTQHPPRVGYTPFDALHPSTKSDQLLPSMTQKKIIAQLRGSFGISTTSRMTVSPVSLSLPERYTFLIFGNTRKALTHHELRKDNTISHPARTKPYHKKCNQQGGNHAGINPNKTVTTSQSKDNA